MLGLILIFVGLRIAIKNPDLSGTAFWIIRILVSLGGGFVAAGIFGNITISGPILDVSVKAGGPIALTVFFYAVTPKTVKAIKKKIAA